MNVGMAALPVSCLAIRLVAAEPSSTARVPKADPVIVAVFFDP
jgi:hypothetical protein